MTSRIRVDNIEGATTDNVTGIDLTLTGNLNTDGNADFNGIVTSLVGLVVNPSTFTSAIASVQKPYIELGAPTDNGRTGHLFINGSGTTSDKRLLIQWGFRGGSTSGSTVTFPIEYTGNESPCVLVCSATDSSGGAVNSTVNQTYKDRFTVWQKSLSTAPPGNLGQTLNWVSFGYVNY